MSPMRSLIRSFGKDSYMRGYGVLRLRGMIELHTCGTTSGRGQPQGGLAEWVEQSVQSARLVKVRVFQRVQQRFL
jgi:hypothetical protein